MLERKHQLHIDDDNNWLLLATLGKKYSWPYFDILAIVGYIMKTT